MRRKRLATQGAAIDNNMKAKVERSQGRQGERKGISDKQIRKCDRRRVSEMTGSVKKQIETEAKEGRRIKARWRREKEKN